MTSLNFVKSFHLIRSSSANFLHLFFAFQDPQQVHSFLSLQENQNSKLRVYIAGVKKAADA